MPIKALSYHRTKEEVPVSDLLWMLLDSGPWGLPHRPKSRSPCPGLPLLGLPLQHAEDRQRFREALAEAHRTALDCSREEATVPTVPTASPRSSGKVQGLGLMSLLGIGFTSPLNICWRLIPNSWVMLN